MEMKFEVKKNMDWGKQHLPAIEKAIKYHCAAHIINIRTATEKEDCEEATDMVIEIKSGTIGIRIRRPEYYKYGDITIRYSLPSGEKTEWQKLKDGKLRWYFYGWSDGQGDLQDWCLLDMKKFPFLEENRLNIKTNIDGTSFACFSLSFLDSYDCLFIRKGKKITKQKQKILNDYIGL